MTHRPQHSPGHDRHEGDRGSASLEILGAVPIVIVLILALIQASLVAYAVLGTEQAARDGARAYSLGYGTHAAVDQSLPASLHARSVQRTDDTVTVRVSVPRVKPFPRFVVERDATMPRSDS